MKKTLFMILVFSICLFEAFSVQVGARADVSCSAAFAFPKMDYVKFTDGPASRTSMSVDGDVLLDVKFPVNTRSAISVDAGVALDWTSRSLEWNNTMLLAYRAIGGTLGAFWYFNDSFNIGFKYRLLYCTQVLSGNHFIAMDYELVPCYTPLNGDYYSVGVTLPVVLSVKADFLTVRAGLGVKLGLGAKESAR